MIKRVSEALSKKENGEKGFTLIELLVVVIIIGILAAVAIPIFLNMRTGAWKSSVESDVSNAVLVVEQAATASNGSLSGATVTGQAGPGEPYDVSGFAGTTSPDNTVTISITEQTYTITGENENVDETYTYDSTTGSGEWN